MSRLRGLVVALIVLHAPASFADDRCRDLPAHPSAKFAGPPWKRAPVWSALEFTVTLDRAPHLARAILADCPGVTIEKLEALDARRFSTAVRVKVANAEALARITQLPAVREVHHHDGKGKPEGAPRFPIARDD